MTIADPVLSHEPIDNILESGLEPLLREHWDEVAHDKDLIALSPDWPAYRTAQREHKFIGFAYRRNGFLIGYSGFFVQRSFHYRDHVFAMNDVIFLRKRERGIDGIGLILEAEKYMRGIGASKLFYHVKTDFVLGDGADDSLDAADNVAELSRRFGIDLPDEAFGLDRTLAAVLKRLGYIHAENHMTKTLVEKR